MIQINSPQNQSEFYHQILKVFGLVSLFLTGTESLAVSIPDVSSLISTTDANAMITTIGTAMDHRPYEPATAMGTALGLSFGIETTLVQPPTQLTTALTDLTSITGSSSSTTVPILGAAKLHIRKGITSHIDVGVSFFPPISSVPYVGKSFLIGGDVKIVIWAAEEGLTWAIRGSYNVNSFDVSESGYELDIKSATLTPTLLVSKKMDFADSYLGLGLQYTYGSILASITVPSPSGDAIAPISVSQSGRGYGALVFGGVDMRVPGAGFRITIEGAYSPFGVNSLGTKIGFSY